ncbi:MULTISPECIES: OmpH family outer membrane protein [Algibacter]|jgi:outer membrane protein|uniref:Outer membrane protein H n=1 Tax=Algibacter lectus TaxID=221126 RepID=A0A090WUE3_9FLAO|nr:MULTISPECIES: OmpH family outer membrane protein [Algibacter]MDO7138084.1 OmpH family outer membrane protein [Algibacter lectus]MWW26400.1 OmpH family outer membrane protein [Algibacter lectus]TDY60016.1 periplasmic chaperone for outer membrane proteins Skp [Algibacter lectus]SFD40956.1 periplasmic chaperone for outer membrane proteins Skp [Algibacter lectus]GAL63457.1 outer membrane protein H precursor [Algibacter lectus]
MKHFKTLLLATALCIGTISFTQAQTKVAHINTQELIKAMPEMKTAQAELESLSKTYQTDMQGSVTEFQNLQKQYEAEAKNKTDEENQKRILELQEKQQRLQQFQADAQKDLQAKEIALLQPITEKAKAAILKVSRAQGFDYVLDSGVGVTILADGKDLLNDVKKDLGI